MVSTKTILNHMIIYINTEEKSFGGQIMLKLIVQEEHGVSVACQLLDKSQKER